ncbi:MAG: NRDE family protein, partial [Myxococcales bacterium]|nr:NRDE family protein [Myxococcales bacterium]
MCTVIALHRCVPGFPLVLAANRDEFFERPAEGIALRETT